MNAKTMIVIAAILGGAAVGMGAFAAHGLPSYLEKQGVTGDEVTKRLANVETGARYQMYHALALLAIGGFSRGALCRTITGYSFTVGTLIFSGCLYGIAFTGVKILGAIVPIGGVLMIVGWVALAVSALIHHEGSCP